MNENFLLKTKNAERLYFECAKDLPIIDFHNHISVADIKADKKYDNIDFFENFFRKFIIF